MFELPELNFELAKLHHRELVDEAAKERLAARVHRHGHKRRRQDRTTR
ncbi:hypothetical protein Cs7R123_66610 [Catellatospora sp. TT07R-123]|nr:hypothetical protein [Catellatospora sp. TT07R-123]GHJ49319.1 hypothetical protein Cs7R123_66610 [Catellatospora sp. TT07R-123]